MKNPFKKQGIVDSLVNVGVGGAANVAMDYAFGMIPQVSALSATVKNAIKIGVGVLGGSMTTNKYIRAAVDGIATVGVSNIVAGYVNGTPEAPAGLQETIGAARRRAGNAMYRKRVSGCGTVNEVLGY